MHNFQKSPKMQTLKKHSKTSLISITLGPKDIETSWNLEAKRE